MGRRTGWRSVALAFAVVAVVGSLCAVVRAAPERRAPEPGAELTISVLTFGPGDHPFYKFGHDAILVHDAMHRRDDVYNYGTFDFHSATLVPDFLKGRLRYWLSVQPLAATVEHYRSEKRSITVQELALSPPQRHALATRLAHDALPANRYYRYDYYGDNCSTRVRDVIDWAIGGRLRAASTAPASLTFRGHTLRLTADDLAVYLGLDVAMGDVVDRPITQWEEMFLPSKVQESLRRVTFATPADSVPLVARETVLLDAARPPLRDAPPRWGLRMGLVGLSLGGLLAALGYASRGASQDTRVPSRRAARGGSRDAPRGSSRGARVARVVLGLALALLGAVGGLLGSIFVFFWAATDHAVAHHNENILQCFPLGLTLAAFAVGLVWGSPKAARAVSAVTAILAACSMVGLALKALPWFDQQNGALIALLLPIWIGAALGARWTALA
jgi:Domain of unknown function (DUF4105)